MTIKKDTGILKIDFLKLVDVFEKNVQQGGEPLVSVTASGVLSDCLSLENQNSAFIYSRLSTVNSHSLLQQLLDINKPKSDIKKIDGTNYGCPYSGYYD